MDEQRRETDFNLLRVLLENSRDLETEFILSGDSALIDDGLLQTLYLTVPPLTQEGLADAAKFLQNLIAPLEAALTQGKRVTPEAYLTFLGTLLQAVTHNPDPQEIYPLLSANLDKLDHHFAQLLRDWATAILPEAELAQARRLAAQIGNLSIIIGRFPLGSRGNNLEIEIAGYEVVATVFTREGFPEQWATLQNNLGNAYSDRLQGERAGNLEKAIACFENALQVRIPQGYPEQWATLQNNLGNAYSDRLQGDPAQNLELAIACYHNALQVRTRDTLPQEWAATQNNLGRAYSHRLKGERAENLELAIACYLSALQIYNRKSDPRRWATTQNNLANAYSDRLRGDRAENLEKAIECYQRALQVRTREALPGQWATTQNNLGRAFSERLKGNKVDNVEAAIACFQNAQQVHSRRKFPERWAAIQTHLGRAYSLRLQGEHSDNVEAAIACYQKALLVYNRKKFSDRWAMLNTYLGRVLSEHLKGNKAMNLSSAIACYQNALQVYTRDKSPERWAMLQTYLGRAFCDRYAALTTGGLSSQQEAEEHLLRAVRCYQKALGVYNREANPQNYAKTLFYLGLTYKAQGNYRAAYEVFATAIDTVEFSRGELFQAVKPTLAQTWEQLYKSAVTVCLELAASETDYAATALEWVERYKAFRLVELLANCSLHPKAELLQYVRDELELLQQEITTEQRRLDKVARTGAIASPLSAEERQELNCSSIPLSSDFTRLHQLQQALDRLIAREIQPVDPFFSAMQKVEPLTFHQIQELLPDQHSVLIEWASLGEMLMTFILLPDATHPIVYIYPPENARALEEWTSEYLTAYSEQKGRWVNQLIARLTRAAELLELDRIVSYVPASCEQLILIPHRFLHLIPIHALPLGAITEGLEEPSSLEQAPVLTYLMDRFPKGIRYAPNSQLLRLGNWGRRTLRGTSPLRHLFGVHSSTKELIYSHLEVKRIGRYFAAQEVLGPKNPIKEAFDVARSLNELAEGQLPREQVQPGMCVHFACQGMWNLDQPLQSAVALGSESLTLEEIFDLDLRQYRLVTLSACEMMIGDGYWSGNDSVGFPAGLLCAGIPSIVSSLWKVSDVSTLLLMSKFYEKICQLPRLQVGDVAIALNEAQKWLRGLTSDEFELLLNDLKSPIAQIFAQLPQGSRLIAEASLQQTRNRKPCPFANPYHWAAFTATGI